MVGGSQQTIAAPCQNICAADNDDDNIITTNRALTKIEIVTWTANRNYFLFKRKSQQKSQSNTTIGQQ